MKKRIVVVCLLIALLAMVSTGTIAYFTVNQKAQNAITTGELSFQLHQTTADGTPYPDEPIVIMPGDVQSKIVTVENTGMRPMYLRIKLTAAVNDGALDATECMLLDINESDWIVDGEYYYYKTALEAGETTTPLFTQVTFVGNRVTNAYLGKLLSLDVAAFAVQSDHNGTAPQDAVGWPEE